MIKNFLVSLAQLSDHSHFFLKCQITMITYRMSQYVETVHPILAVGMALTYDFEPCSKNSNLQTRQDGWAETVGCKAAADGQGHQREGGDQAAGQHSQGSTSVRQYVVISEVRGHSGNLWFVLGSLVLALRHWQSYFTEVTTEGVRRLGPFWTIQAGHISSPLGLHQPHPHWTNVISWLPCGAGP